MSTKKKIKQINLIPLINIIFLMLIFFMLAGTITTIDPHKVCLLYTSPSPRDRTRSRMPSSA